MSRSVALQSGCFHSGEGTWGWRGFGGPHSGKRMSRNRDMPGFCPPGTWFEASAWTAPDGSRPTTELEWQNPLKCWASPLCVRKPEHGAEETAQVKSGCEEPGGHPGGGGPAVGCIDRSEMHLQRPSFIRYHGDACHFETLFLFTNSGPPGSLQGWIGQTHL